MSCPAVGMENSVIISLIVMRRILPALLAGGNRKFSEGLRDSPRRPTELRERSNRTNQPNASHRRCDRDRKSTRLNSSHQIISYAVFCLKKKKNKKHIT